MHFLSLKKLNTRTIKRSTVAGIIIILAFSALVFRIFWLQTAGFEKYQELVIDQMTTESAVKATRGKIYDKNGKVAAAYASMTQEVMQIEGRTKNRPGPDWVR